MASFNRVILVGNLTRKPELRQAGQTSVTDIVLAVNDKRKDKNGNWVETCDFIDVTLWGKTAETVCQYLDKGSSVLIEGRLRLEQWEQDGQKRSKLKVVGERMQMLGSKGQSQGQPQQPASQSTGADIPF